MKINALISNLDKIKNEFGNLDVVIVRNINGLEYICELEKEDLIPDKQLNTLQL